MSGKDLETDDSAFPYWRANLIVLPIWAFVFTLGFHLCWPFLPLMVRGLGVTENLETWVGIMLLAFYVIGFITNPIWGGVADHFGRKIMILRATLGMGFFMLFLPLAPSPIWFAAILMVVGIFNGANSAGIALLVANTPKSRIGSALSMVHSGTLVGRLVGPAAGALVATIIGQYHSMFWISSALMLAAGLMVIIWVKEVHQRMVGAWRPHWIGDLRALVAVPRMGELLLLFAFISVLWNANVTMISIFVIELLGPGNTDVGAEAFWVGAVALALPISSLVVMPLWGRVLDRVNTARVLEWSLFAAALAHVPLLFLDTPMQLVFARVAFGVAATAMQPALFQLVRIYAPAGMDARAISYGTSFQFIAMGLAPFTAGFVAPAFGLRAYFAMNIVITLLGLLLWLRSARRA